MVTDIIAAESRDLKSRLDTSRPNFAQALITLREMTLGRDKVERAINLANAVKVYLNRFDDPTTPEGMWRQHKLNLDKSHKSATRIEAEAMKDAQALLSYYKQVVSEWRIAEDLRVAKERRIAEAASIKAQEEALVSEALALEAQGRKAEAAAKLTEPVTPIITEVEKVKLEGTSMVEVWVPETDDDGDIVFETADKLQACLVWLASNWPHTLDIRSGELKKTLTRNSGLVQPPGLKILKKYEPRNRT